MFSKSNTHKRESRPPAVVIGLDCMTGLQTARILAYRHAVPVIGIAKNPHHPCCRTRSCRRVLFSEGWGPELVHLLETLGRDLPERAVLYPCTDLSVLEISRSRASLGRWYHILLPEAEVVETLVDKAGFYRFARSHGFTVPLTFLLHGRRDVEEAAAQLKFPAILKPAVKTPQWQQQFQAKCFRIDSADELSAFYDRCAEHAGTMLIQEWVQGEDSCNFTCNCYFGAESQPLVTFVTRKLRQWPPDTGTGCLGQECKNDFVLRETVRFFQAARHRGFGYLEMKLDERQGEYVIIEPNIGRPTGRSATAEAAGVEFIFTQYCDALGLTLPENRNQKYTGVKWVYLRRDIQSALSQWRQGKLGLQSWTRSLAGKKVEALFSWQDPAPFFADFAKGIRLLVKARRTSGLVAFTKAAGRITNDADPAPATIDFDIHGLAGIRLINASPRDAAVVRRQLGPLERPLRANPEIQVRFEDHLPLGRALHVEWGKSGFAGNDFYVLRSKKGPAKVLMDFQHVGNTCEIRCQKGIRAVPLLLPLLHLTLLKKDCVPLHASAFVHNGIGIVVTGWSKGGKTEALLAFARRGARYVGDEWVLLTGDGQRAYGIPEHIRLQEWHMTQLPHVWAQLSLADRMFFGTVHCFENFLQLVPRRLLERSGLGRRLGDAIPALRRQLNTQFDPHRIFGASMGPYSMSPQKIFLMISHSKPDIEVEPADPMEIAQRMAESIRYEQLPFFSTYLAYRFAFPERGNEFIENAHILQRDILRRALAHKEAYVVRHPYPCSLDALFEHMNKFCKGDTCVDTGPSTGGLPIPVEVCATNPAGIPRTVEASGS